MRERIDPLIEERAAWLFKNNIVSRNSHHLLNKMLGYDRTVELGTELQDESNEVIMRRMADLIAKDVTITGLENVPTDGPALIVADAAGIELSFVPYKGGEAATLAGLQGETDIAGGGVHEHVDLIRAGQLRCHLSLRTTC